MHCCVTPSLSPVTLMKGMMSSIGHQSFFFTWFSFLWRQVFVSTKTIQRNSCFCNNEHALSALHFVCTVKHCNKKNALNLKGREEEEHCRCWMLWPQADSHLSTWPCPPALIHPTTEIWSHPYRIVTSLSKKGLTAKLCSSHWNTQIFFPQLLSILCSWSQK